MKDRSTAPMRIAKTGYIVISVIMMVIGILFIIMPSSAADWLSTICGITIGIFGIIRIIGYFSRDLYRLAFQYDLELGIIMLIAGIVILMFGNSFINLMSILFGLTVLADGLFRFRVASDARKFGLRKWWLILAAAVCSCIIGTLMAVFPDKGSLAMAVLIGISLLIEGIMNLVVAIITVRIIRHQKPDYIDVEFNEQ